METLIQKRNTNLEAYKYGKYSANSDHHFCALGKNMAQVTGFWKRALNWIIRSLFPILCYLKTPLGHPPPQRTGTSAFYLYFRPPILSILYSFDCTDFSEPKVSQNLQAAPFLLCGWSGFESSYNSNELMHAYIREKIKANPVRFQAISIIQSVSVCKILYS